MADSAASPVDRGYAWVILAAAFGIHVLGIGVAKSFGMIYIELLDRFQMSSGSTAWIMALNFSLVCGLGSISTALGEAFTYRRVIIVGGVLTMAGFVCSAFVTKMEVLYVTYGIMSGIGIGLTAAPTMVMASLYFEKRITLANGITVSGSCIGTFVWAFVYNLLFVEYSFFSMWLMIGAICLHICVLGALMRPFPVSQGREQRGDTIVDELTRERIDTNIGHDIEPRSETQVVANQNTQYGSTAANQGILQSTSAENQKSEAKCQKVKSICLKCIPDYTFLANQVFWVYLVSFICAVFAHISNLIVVPAFAQYNGIPLESVATILSLSSLADMCGRIILAWIADMNLLNRRYIFAVCMALSGMAAFVAPLTTTITTIAIYGAWYGFFGGAVWAMMTVLLVDAFGKERFPRAFGLLYSLISLPTLAAPPVFGWLKDLTGDWRLSLTISGVFNIISMITIMLEPAVRRLSSGTYDQL